MLCGRAQTVSVLQADGSVDAVVSAGAFSSLAASARRELAASVARVLKPGGVFVFIERSELLVTCSVM